MSKMLDHMLDWTDYAVVDLSDYFFMGCCLAALVVFSPVWLPLWAIGRVQQTVARRAGRNLRLDQRTGKP